jgi:hypothetical protein
MNTLQKGMGALLGGVAILAACGGSGGTGTGGAGGASSSSHATSASSNAASSSGTGGSASAGPKVFIILMENHNWVDLKGDASAPYINGLLATGAHAEQYFNPPSLHPSEPNYLWLEAGTNFGIANDIDPGLNAQSTTSHLVTQLVKAGHTWKSYQEDIPGTNCPLSSVMKYAPKHNPMVFFKDVTDNNDTKSANCIAHVRPYTELAADLAADKTANYNFLTPNLCNDMHDSCAPLNDNVKQGDTWLSTEVPKLLASKAVSDGAVVIITWDEGEGTDGPIGLIVLGHSVKVGYSNTIHYTHSSTLRTVQTIFGLSPFLGDAANATDLSDLFTALP